MAGEVSLEESKRLYRERFERVVDALVAESFDAMVARTPVEDGDARGAWRREGRTITNNAPHVLRLEWGWSDQAPIGMARVTISESQHRVNRIAQELP